MKEEYKLYKIKAAVKLYSNPDTATQMVRGYEENAEESGRRLKMPRNMPRNWVWNFNYATQVPLLKQMITEGGAPRGGTRDFK